MKRTYDEFNIINILYLKWEEFQVMLDAEVYSLVLYYKLLLLKNELLELEEYMHVHVIQGWFDEHNIKFF